MVFWLSVFLVLGGLVSLMVLYTTEYKYTSRRLDEIEQYILRGEKDEETNK